MYDGTKLVHLNFNHLILKKSEKDLKFINLG